MTKVEEWTKAETGVGAAIAAGSQAENGIWALFVIAASITVRETTSKSDKGEETWPQQKKLESPVTANHPIKNKIQISPTRFLKTVSIPALLDFFVG